MHSGSTLIPRCASHKWHMTREVFICTCWSIFYHLPISLTFCWFLHSKSNIVSLKYCTHIQSLKSIVVISTLLNLTPPIFLSLSLWLKQSSVNSFGCLPSFSRPSPTELYSVSTKQDSERWGTGSNLSLFGGCQHTTERRRDLSLGMLHVSVFLNTSSPTADPSVWLTKRTHTCSQSRPTVSTPSVLCVHVIRLLLFQTLQS